ncbi:hypothetical protein SLA2020_003710 [Shorea laevis]
MKWFVCPRILLTGTAGAPRGHGMGAINIGVEGLGPWLFHAYNTSKPFIGISINESVLSYTYSTLLNGKNYRKHYKLEGKSKMYYHSIIQYEFWQSG